MTQSINKIREWFIAFRLTLDPSTIRYLSGKSTQRGFLLHSMSPWYYRRERLWKEGSLYWVYVFKVASPMGDFHRPLPGWVLFSPSSRIQDHKEHYELMYLKLEQWMTSAEAKVFPKLIRTIESLTSEPLMIPLPDSLTDGQPFYLTSVTFYTDHFDYPENGYFLAVAHLQHTKEMMLLPKKFYQQI